ncbi:anti-sigma regulatory factor (Ser/Thr protein kinase) [Actinoplanes octamycinicus]|uniref:Anti-sigma regulatory factor (Ser/Thr protein kinase) n=1 Tax=Actinoplanes octamycinicus TaxID=135948 RepID=A0A7W7MBE0_9ACTN|nr:ATP-binding protein [Actinoplanes octamycinicus]MBB4744018.1 anti-sigma regulatory factor (Ser/Thr protein kinase) [Actinoplanes octamycinicus]GIE58643.1 hypothetical protein Aoc01nite_40450 [Actinoplanes octamycinicus]
MSELATQVDVPRGPQAPAAARGAVIDALRGWGLHEQAWLGNVSVVVSELVTNAVLHGGGPITLILRLDERGLTLTVADGSPALPHRRDPDLTGGRGLMLIEALSSRWGVLHDPGGKRVWAELPPCPSDQQLTTSNGRAA